MHERNKPSCGPLIQNQLGSSAARFAGEGKQVKGNLRWCKTRRHDTTAKLIPWVETMVTVTRAVKTGYLFTEKHGDIMFSRAF